MTKQRIAVRRRLLCDVRMVLAMMVASTCITGTGCGYPLYSGPELLEEEKVASLTGYVHDVDGKDVSAHGQSFDLLPGCHIVGTPSKWGTMDSRAGVVITTGPHKFAIPMKAGHSYIVEVGSSSAYFSAPASPAYVSAREMDARGKTSRTFAPATSAQELQDCPKQAQP
jgi:hypothetical protein